MSNSNQIIEVPYSGAATVETVNSNYPAPIPVNRCSWYQKPGNANNCSFSPVAVVQSVFALPSKIVEPALLSIPAPLVPIAGLAVNVGAWYLVWKVVEKWVIEPRWGSGGRR